MLESQEYSGAQVVFLARHLQYLEGRGVAIEPILHYAGLTRKDLFPVSQRVPYSKLIMAMEKMVDTVDIPAHGLWSSERIIPSDYGVVGFAMECASNLRGYLTNYMRYQALFGLPSWLEESFREEQDYAVIAATEVEPLGKLKQFALEEFLSGWLYVAEWMREIVHEHPTPLEFISVHLNTSTPDCAEVYRERLQCPVYFEQDCNEIRISKKYLDLELVTANPELEKSLLQQCEVMLERLKQAPGIKGKVRQILVENPSVPESLSDIATRLTMSDRSLRRKLFAEGSSYKELLFEIRMKLAGELLAGSAISGQEVAFKVGYKDSANFHRAFKGWYGKTPKDYRSSQDAGVSTD